MPDIEASVFATLAPSSASRAPACITISRPRPRWLRLWHGATGTGSLRPSQRDRAKVARRLSLFIDQPLERLSIEMVECVYTKQERRARAFGRRYPKGRGAT